MHSMPGEQRTGDLDDGTIKHQAYASLCLCHNLCHEARELQLPSPLQHRASEGCNLLMVIGCSVWAVRRPRAARICVFPSSRPLFKSGHYAHAWRMSGKLLSAKDKEVI